MSETHYSGSEQRFMSARTYYRRTADEQTLVRESLEERGKSYIIHLTSSHSFHTTFLSSSNFSLICFLSSPSPDSFLFPLPPPVFLPFLFILCLDLSSSSFFLIKDTLHVSDGHTHTYMLFSNKPLGCLVCRHDIDVPQPPKQQISYHSHTPKKLKT